MLRARRFWLIFLLSLPLLPACGRDGIQSADAVLGSGDLRWSQFPVAIQVDSQILANPNAEQDLQAAIDYWETRAGRRLFQTDGAWDGSKIPYEGSPSSPQSLLANVVFLHQSWPFDGNIAGKTLLLSSGNTIQAAVVLLNAEKICPRNCDAGVDRQKLMAHELGHFLGFAHSSDEEDLMFPEILPGSSLSSMNIDEPLLLKLTQ